VRDLIMATPYPGIAILPGSDATEDFYVKRPWETGPLQFVLRDALGDVGTAYDLVLMDCPPNLLLPSWASLAASDAVCIPLQPEEFAAGGVAKMDRPIAEARRRINPQLVMIGYLMTMYNKSLLVHTSYEADLRQVYGDDVFRAVVPLAKDFKEAVTLKKPVGVYKPRSAAAKAIAGLAVELLDRLALRTSAIEDVRAA
jgi:chromosome partitioning protein